MAKKICNVPGCGDKPVGRGLCGTHYCRLRARNAEYRAEAERYATPPRTGPNVPPAPPAETDAGESRDDETRPLAGRTDEAIADDKIALLCEFATAAGIAHHPYRGGRMFVREEWGDRVLILTPSGRLRWASLHAEPAA